MIFKKNYDIQLKDIGKENYVKNIGLLEYLENIGASHSSLAGYGVEDMNKTKLTWVLLDWKLKVIKRPKYGQTLYTSTWGREAKRCYTYRDFTVCDENNNIYAIATSKWLIYNIETKKPAKLTDEILEKYELENDKSVFNIKELDKLKEPEQFESCITYKVNRADIDLNKHMHNLYYLNLAYEALPEDVYENTQFDDIRITYKKEIKLGATVKCKYTKQENKHIVTIFSEDESIVHSIIELS